MKATDVMVTISSAEHIRLHVPGEGDLSRVLELDELEYTAGLSYSVRLGLQKPICGAQEAMLTQFGNGLAVVPNIWKVTMYESFPTKDETAAAMDVQEFAMLCEMAVSMFSQKNLYDNNSPDRYFMGVQVNKELLGEFAIYNPWTGQLRTHLPSRKERMPRMEDFDQ